MQALKSQLQAHCITREQIAAAANVSQTYVTHWWNGRRKAPRIAVVAERMLAVAKAKAARARAAASR